MQATERLMEEHRLIERLIAVLERAAGRLEAGQAVRPGLFLQACDFIKNFADGSHHRKEEGVLFVVMQAHGVPGESGPIGVMLHEHEQGRAFTRVMLAAAERLEGGDPSAQTTLINAARGYAALLRQHILKEDRILFPMADRAIPSEIHAQVLAGFEEAEPDESAKAVRRKYQALTEDLEAELQ